MSDKIINTFQQRRQLDQAFADLAQTQNEAELVQAARQIAHSFPVDLVLTALVKYLDTGNSQIRGGLGHVAALLPADEVLPALRNVAAKRQLAPQARLNAASIAQRFLGVELPAALLADLTDTEEIAFQSLREALDEAQRNRYVLLEYVTQMQEHGEEIAAMVMGLLERVEPAERVELLRLIAQDERPRVARGALTRLERLALSEEMPQAVRALYTLQAALAEDLAEETARSLRKVRFSGKVYHPTSTTGWRALLSPADPNSSQSVWLLYRPDTAQSNGILLGFARSEGVGMSQFFGTEVIDRTLLPPAQPVGEMVTVTMDNGRTATMLEAPFDYGRWLLQRAIAHMQAVSGKQPLPGEYKLYNDLIWQFAPPAVEPALLAIWHSSTTEKPSPVDAETLATYTTELFHHPVMANWQLRNWALMPNSAQLALPLPDLVAALLGQIAKSSEGLQLGQALAAGLRAQAAWLQIAQQPTLAAHALLLAEHLPHLSITANPVLAHMLTNAINANQHGRQG
ncbi:MAG: hypothetical protein R3C14_31665 [Caldilineaceae bacterium]